MPEAFPARRSRRMPRPRAALAALACALLLGAAACSSADAGEPDASTASPSPAATDEPIFASDEEALAAAVEAYEAYSETSWQIAAEGGAEAERIRPLVSDRLAEQFIEEFEALADSGIRSTGSPRIFGARLAERNESEQSEQVSAYLCQDVGGVRLLDAAGGDVTPADRAAISAVLVRFESYEPGSSQLILEDVEKWDDDSFCA